MPELPEVETVRLGLAPALTGALIEQAEIRDPRLTRPFDPEAVAAALRGERVAALERRGKYLLWRLASGRTLVVHLRMTGSFRTGVGDSIGESPHVRALLRLDTGLDVAYRDVRRFGTWELLEAGDLGGYLRARLGPEPLGGSFSARRLGAALAGRHAALKAALLDQRVVAGLGNIYADEALWQARLSPVRPAGSLSEPELRRLQRALRAALRTGLERQEATLRDYAAPDGARGTMQDAFRAYGRAGEPCERCGTLLSRALVGGRGTAYCPRCQA